MRFSENINSQTAEYYPPPAVRPRLLRVTRLVGGCSTFVVVGEVTSEPCLRFREALDNEGVLLFGPDETGAVAGVDEGVGMEFGAVP
jgi:hypothetical protein